MNIQRNPIAGIKAKGVLKNEKCKCSKPVKFTNPRSKELKTEY